MDGQDQASLYRDMIDRARLGERCVTLRYCHSEGLKSHFLGSIGWHYLNNWGWMHITSSCGMEFDLEDVHEGSVNSVNCRCCLKAFIDRGRVVTIDRLELTDLMLSQQGMNTDVGISESALRADQGLTIGSEHLTNRIRIWRKIYEEIWPSDSRNRSRIDIRNEQESEVTLEVRKRMRAGLTELRTREDDTT